MLRYPSVLKRSYSRLIPALGILLSVSALTHSYSAHAAPLPGAAIESKVGEFLLERLTEDPIFVTKVLGMRSANAEEILARLKEPSFHDVRSSLEARFSKIRESLHEAHVQRNGGRELPEARELSEDEKLVLREAAAQKLSIDPESVSADASRIRFMDEAPSNTLASNRERFMSAAKEEDFMGAAETPAEEAPEAIQEKGRKGIIDWYKEAQACLESRPPAANRKMELRNLAEQLAISAGVTTVGTVARVGVTNIELPAFGLDMLMSFISTGVTMMWNKSTDTFQIRWLKVFTWGHLRSNLDAVVYRINPWTDTHGQPIDEAATEREQFNISWNAKTSWTNPLMFTILNGAECLAETNGAPKIFSQIQKNRFWIKTAVAINNSILYYRVRSNSVRSSAVRSSSVQH